jgi:hypothetical protein
VQKAEAADARRQVAECEVALEAERSAHARREAALLSANERLLARVDELSALVARLQAQVVELTRANNTAMLEGAATPAMLATPLHSVSHRLHATPPPPMPPLGSGSGGSYGTAPGGTSATPAHGPSAATPAAAASSSSATAFLAAIDRSVHSLKSVARADLERYTQRLFTQLATGTPASTAGVPHTTPPPAAPTLNGYVSGRLRGASSSMRGRTLSPPPSHLAPPLDSDGSVPWGEGEAGGGVGGAPGGGGLLTSAMSVTPPPRPTPSPPAATGTSATRAAGVNGVSGGPAHPPVSPADMAHSRLLRPTASMRGKYARDPFPEQPATGGSTVRSGAPPPAAAPVAVATAATATPHSYVEAHPSPLTATAAMLASATATASAPAPSPAPAPAQPATPAVGGTSVGGGRAGGGPIAPSSRPPLMAVPEGSSAGGGSADGDAEGEAEAEGDEGSVATVTTTNSTSLKPGRVGRGSIGSVHSGGGGGGGGGGARSVASAPSSRGGGKMSAQELFALMRQHVAGAKLQSLISALAGFNGGTVTKRQLMALAATTLTGLKVDRGSGGSGSGGAGGAVDLLAEFTAFMGGGA